MAGNFKYFVLLANMRTGSNLFEHNIRLYQDFSCHGELFNPHFIGYPDVTELYDTNMTEREKSPQRLLGKMVQAERKSMPGFRLFADHDQRILAHCLADPDCAKILLTRNPLDSFVSHAIARATDQWKLTDASKRKKAKIEFDFAAFKSYLNRLHAFLSEIRRGLQISGQTAYHLRYENLNDVDVFNGLSAYLGSKEVLKELKEKIVRQNPEGLEEKVSNYQDMLAQIGSLDLLGAQTVPVLETARNPSPRNFKAGKSVPILLMPMHKSEFPQVEAWLREHEKSNCGSSELNEEMSQKKLGQWLGENPKRLALTFLTHPAERAYNAFYQHIFCSGDDLFPWIRTTLENHYNVELPDRKLTRTPNRSVLENSGYSAMHHRKAFVRFLRFLKSNLQGQTRARVDQSWATQNSILQGYNRLVFPDALIRKESLAESLLEIESKLGLNPIPLPDLSASDHCYSLSEIYSPEIEAVARTVYARDYQMFGFSNWAAG